MRLRPPMQAVRSRFRCQKSAFSQQHIWIGRAVDRDLTMIAAKCDRCLLQDSESVKLTQQAVQKTACALDSLPYLRRVKPPVMLGVVDLADMRIDQRRIAHMDDTVQTCKNKFIKHRLLEASRDGTDLRPDFTDERRAAGPAHWFKKTAVGVAVPNFRDQIIDRGVSHARPEDTAGTQAGCARRMENGGAANLIVIEDPRPSAGFRQKQFVVKHAAFLWPAAAGHGGMAGIGQRRIDASDMARQRAAFPEP